MYMKKMTCNDIGGACNAIIQGNTAEEMVNNATEHVIKMSKKDDGHKRDKEMIDQTQQDPQAGKKWFAEFQVKFAALPEE
jgi:predicted small metal-binding protein